MLINRHWDTVVLFTNYLQTNFQKPIDFCGKVWYNVITVKDNDSQPTDVKTEKRGYYEI